MGQSGERDATVKINVEQLDERSQLSSPTPIALAFHRRVAARLLRDGAADRAFAELMRGLQEFPVDGAYAAELVMVARQAGAEVAAAAGLEHALGRAAPEQRSALRRRLARVYRRLGRWHQARDHLLHALREDPRDVRARRQLVLVTLQQGDYPLAAEQLAAQADEAAHRSRFRAASRHALVRARLVEERLADLLGAAAAYRQAAEYARNVNDVAAVFSARILAARALVAGQAPPPQVESALRDLAEAGREAHRESEAAAIAAEIGRSAGLDQARTAALLSDAALAQGAPQEANALLEPEPADASQANRLESHFIGRGAWGDLAAHYRERAAREPGATAKAELLHKLAELLEDELADRIGAAEVYSEIVALTGDPTALVSQVRLLSASTDPAAVHMALDAAVRTAREPQSRAEALLLRAEVHLGARRLDRACPDFEAALALAPDNLRALSGLAECRADRPMIERLDEAVQTLPRGAANRVTLLRRLARLLEWPLAEELRARHAWREVQAESPSDAEAEGRLIELARQANDREDLIQLLRRHLAREPRGVAARQARHELAQVLESIGRDEEALEVWRMAARMEPGDAVALVALADRCEVRGRFSETAMALEGAAAATELGPERAALWRRLGRLCRDCLADPARAAVCEERARQLLTPPSPPTVSVAARRTSQELPQLEAGPPSSAERPVSKPLTDLGEERLRAATEPEIALVGQEIDPDEVEIKTGDILSVVSVDDYTPLTRLPPPGGPDLGQTPVAASPLAPSEPMPAASPAPRPARKGIGHQETDDSFKREPSSVPPRERDLTESGIRTRRSSARRKSSEEPKLLARIAADPLEAGSYLLLAEIYERSRESARASLMVEIGRALEGDPFAEPLLPHYTLNATDWASMRHPELRGAGADLFAIVGLAFCSLDALLPKEAGVRRAFSMEESLGTRATAEALLCAVRVLGMRSPDVGAGSIESPPLRAVNTDPPQLLVGRSAINKRLPPAQLRFFAGRA
ncbi:MAG: hypothetical protein HY901_31980, partial [Deltaproteobacteria bacterium]|nr:hypothetical protein [Deltaproteobacteria bacterium]